MVFAYVLRVLCRRFSASWSPSFVFACISFVSPRFVACFSSVCLAAFLRTFIVRLPTWALLLVFVFLPALLCLCAFFVLLCFSLLCLIFCSPAFGVVGFSLLLHFLHAYVIFSIYILCASFPCCCSHVCRLRVLRLHVFRGCIVSIVGKLLLFCAVIFKKEL